MDETTTSLAGPYYLTTDYEGFSSVQYGNPWFGQSAALLGQIDSAQQVGNYLLLCQAEAGRYYLLPLAATSEQQARTQLLGPIPRTTARRHLYQLTGDSVGQPLPFSH